MSKEVWILTEAQDQRPKAQWERNVFGRLLGMQIDVHTSAIVLCSSPDVKKRESGRHVWLYASVDSQCTLSWTIMSRPWNLPLYRRASLVLRCSLAMSWPAWPASDWDKARHLDRQMDVLTWQVALVIGPKIKGQWPKVPSCTGVSHIWNILERLVWVVLRSCLRNSPIVIAFVGSRSSSGKDWKVSWLKLTCSQSPRCNENLQPASCDRFM